VFDAASDTSDDESCHGNSSDYGMPSGEQEAFMSDWGPDSAANEDSVCNKPLYEGTSVTVGAAVVLIMTLALRHHLPWVAVDDLLAMMHIVLPVSSLLPRSRYLFEKLFRSCAGIYDLHYYCPHCYSYLSHSEVDICAHCNKHIQVDLYRNGNFFITLPLAAQLRDMFENSNITELIGHRFDRSKLNDQNIEDIYDGSVYKEVMGNKDDSHISLTWNTDGVPVFNSSNYSMWPIQCLINELPIHLRKKYVLLTALWFGVSKPVMSCFLKPFINECNELGVNGFTWLTGVKDTCTVFVHTLVCSVDSVARCMLQGIKQFNGEYGCSWCLHPGQVVEKGNGTVRVYDAQMYDKRTCFNLVTHAKQALDIGSCCGVLHASSLLLLKQFDIVRGFAVDYMHCILLGVTRSLAGFWFDSEHHDEPYYLGPKTNAVDERLMAMRPPACVSRAPRSIKLRSHWKASEWRNWLHIYSAICIHGLLESTYFKHYLLLVCAIDILNSMSISIHDFNIARDMLILFVSEFASMYGLHNMSYNVHQLLHVADTVQNWGPLWTTSAFPFESGNGLLKKLFHGTQGLPLQVSRKFAIFRKLPILAYKFIPVDRIDIHNFFNDILTIYSPVKKVLRLKENVVLLGQPCCWVLTYDERQALDVVCPTTLPESVASYTRAIIKGYLVAANKTVGRRDNSCIVLSNKVCGIVEKFVVIGDIIFVLYRQVILEREFVTYKNCVASTRNIKVAKISGRLLADFADNFDYPCVFVNNRMVSPNALVVVVCNRNEGD
jgi:Transposase family tnp2